MSKEKMNFVGSVLLKLTPRDKENLDYLAGLERPKVSASEALRAGLELYCDKVSGGIRAEKRAADEKRKGYDEDGNPITYAEPNPDYVED